MNSYLLILLLCFSHELSPDMLKNDVQEPYVVVVVACGVDGNGGCARSKKEKLLLRERGQALLAAGRQTAVLRHHPQATGRGTLTSSRHLKQTSGVAWPVLSVQRHSLFWNS